MDPSAHALRSHQLFASRWLSPCVEADEAGRWGCGFVLRGPSTLWKNTRSAGVRPDADVLFAKPVAMAFVVRFSAAWTRG